MFELVGKMIVYLISGMLSIIIITWVFEQMADLMESISEKHYAIKALSVLLMTAIYIIILGLIASYWRWLL